mmetsp:Transcript_115582/g.307324  ORF Transcript_115582/g.307324 Transcript_115582/m.307324 type:complete len:381 (+) Transcript_115582:91-1233(+)
MHLAWFQRRQARPYSQRGMACVIGEVLLRMAPVRRGLRGLPGVVGRRAWRAGAEGRREALAGAQPRHHDLALPASSLRNGPIGGHLHHAPLGARPAHELLCATSSRGPLGGNAAHAMGVNGDEVPRQRFRDRVRVVAPPHDLARSHDRADDGLDPRGQAMRPLVLEPHRLPVAQILLHPQMIHDPPHEVAAIQTLNVSGAALHVVHHVRDLPLDVHHVRDAHREDGPPPCLDPLCSDFPVDLQMGKPVAHVTQVHEGSLEVNTALCELLLTARAKELRQNEPAHEKDPRPSLYLRRSLRPPQLPALLRLPSLLPRTLTLSSPATLLSAQGVPGLSARQLALGAAQLLLRPQHPQLSKPSPSDRPCAVWALRRPWRVQREV